jgi:peptide chain release factor 2
MDVQAKKAELYDLLHIEEKERRIRDIQAKMQQPEFWQDSQNAAVMSKEAAGLQRIIDDWLAAESVADLERLEGQALLSGPYDHLNALVSFSAGAGGTEAQDWAGMLMRMYTRWAEKRGYRVDVVSLSSGDEAGIKSATLHIVGLYAYGFLKSENGVHRLVRISPFDADKARHTSFALVEVLPELEERVVEINPEDLKIDTFRASGHGGQNVQKVETAVRVTHQPTGLVASSQNERSQAQNKELAVKILQSKLVQLRLAERKEKLDELKGAFVKPEWGHQIRSYVVHPYQLVKDHRTGHEVKDAQRVLDGGIDEFIDRWLRRQVTPG